MMNFTLRLFHLQVIFNEVNATFIFTSFKKHYYYNIKLIYHPPTKIVLVQNSSWILGHNEKLS